MELTAYVRRDELLIDRSAALSSLQGIRSLFVASFAEELPHRWELAERSWFASRDDELPPDDIAAHRREVEELNGRARRIADAHLSGDSVWGHERPEDAVRAVNDYIPTGTGAQWSYVSPAIGAAEMEIISLLENRFGPADREPEGFEFGALSEPLAQILQTYGHAFKRLQKVDIALARVEKDMPRSRPSVTARRRR